MTLATLFKRGLVTVLLLIAVILVGCAKRVSDKELGTVYRGVPKVKGAERPFKLDIESETAQEAPGSEDETPDAE